MSMYREPGRIRELDGPAPRASWWRRNIRFWWRGIGGMLQARAAFRPEYRSVWSQYQKNRRNFTNPYQLSRFRNHPDRLLLLGWIGWVIGFFLSGLLRR